MSQPSDSQTTPDVIDAAHYRSVLGHFATGVTVITAMTRTGPVGFTCQSFSALSLDPPLIWIAPGVASSTWPQIAAVGTFTVNVLRSDQEALARAFAQSGADKFSGVGYDLGAVGSPRLHGVVAHIDCTVDTVVPAGDHLSVVGRVVGLDATHGSPLLFFRGGFGEFSQ